MADRAPIRLAELVRDTHDADAILDSFLTWAQERGFELYPAQEEAVLEIAAGRHVILSTPTGSGKSLVALAMHFKAICEGKRAFYTAPIKALVSEKFFELCEELGAENVGMLTGDASINPRAPVVCCTAEILANMALREGRHTRADYVVMDEFHYYADRDRGIAWQIPLLLLADATFMLMSATLGDMKKIAEGIERRTEGPVAIVTSTERPVPLDFEYRATALHRTIGDLAEEERLPVYLVNFTQRDAAEQAQNLTSMNLCPKEQKKEILAAISGFRFDTPYGKDIRRFITAGIGLHHAGLLPKYRLLMERLAQRGLLKIISGTDTLGVGVNVPIRTVLFTKLYKFDGEQTRILSARSLHQISGRAGRKGFDTRGTVICQAPEHVIENKWQDAKAKDNPKKKKQQRKKPPPRDYVAYNRATFEKLIASSAEPLRSSFAINHGTLTNMMDREVTHGNRHGGYRRLIELIASCHERDGTKSRLRRRAAQLFRSLITAGVLELATVEFDDRPYVRFKEGLQRDFSLYHALSLFMVEALSLLDGGLESYPLDVLSLVEAVLESPRVLLLRQLDKLKGDRIAVLKAEGVPYEERMEELEKVTNPKPNEDFIYDTFDVFREAHPWVRGDNVRPKSIARDAYERFATFNEFDKLYGLQRAEGVLLRYLTETYKALVQTVPDEFKTDPVVELIAFFRTMLEKVDSSLVREWESMLAPGPEEEGEETAAGAEPPRFDITRDPRAFMARLRAEMHLLVKALAARDYEEALVAIRAVQAEEEDASGEEEEAWTVERFEAALAPYFEQYDRIIFDHRARFPDLTMIKPDGERQWVVQQVLLDPEEDKMWYLEARVDLREPGSDEGPLLRLQRIAS